MTWTLDQISLQYQIYMCSLV